jgi:hypothetical protein
MFFYLSTPGNADASGWGWKQLWSSNPQLLRPYHTDTRPTLDQPVELTRRFFTLVFVLLFLWLRWAHIRHSCYLNIGSSVLVLFLILGPNSCIRYTVRNSQDEDTALMNSINNKVTAWRVDSCVSRKVEDKTTYKADIVPYQISMFSDSQAIQIIYYHIYYSIYSISVIWLRFKRSF